MGDSVFASFSDIGERKNKTDVVCNHFIQFLMDFLIFVGVFGFDEGFGDVVDSDEVVEKEDESFAQIDVLRHYGYQVGSDDIVELDPSILGVEFIVLFFNIEHHFDDITLGGFGNRLNEFFNYHRGEVFDQLINSVLFGIFGFNRVDRFVESVGQVIELSCWLLAFRVLSLVLEWLIIIFFRFSEVQFDHFIQVFQIFQEFLGLLGISDFHNIFLHFFEVRIFDGCQNLDQSFERIFVDLLGVFFQKVEVLSQETEVIPDLVDKFHSSGSNELGVDDTAVRIGAFFGPLIFGSSQKGQDLTEDYFLGFYLSERVKRILRVLNYSQQVIEVIEGHGILWDLIFGIHDFFQEFLP